jgi:hypothetical protein
MAMRVRNALSPAAADSAVAAQACLVALASAELSDAAVRSGRGEAAAVAGQKQLRHKRR